MSVASTLGTLTTEEQTKKPVFLKYTRIGPGGTARLYGYCSEADCHCRDPNKPHYDETMMCSCIKSDKYIKVTKN